METLFRGKGVRGYYFSEDSLQRCTPSFWFRDEKVCGRTKQRWKWVLKNYRVLLYAVKKYRPRWLLKYSASELINVLAPGIVVRMAWYDKSKGASLVSFVIIGVGFVIAHLERRRYPLPGNAIAGGSKVPPLLLGNYEPQPDNNWEKDVPIPDELAELVQTAFTTLDERRKQAISLWLGLDGTVLKYETIGRKMGISKQRVAQLLQEGMQSLRKRLGVCTNRPLLQYHKLGLTGEAKRRHLNDKQKFRVRKLRAKL